MNPVPFLIEGGLKLITGKLPRWVYIALAVAAILGLGLHLHRKAVKAAYTAAYNQGVTDEGDRRDKANAKLATQQAAITAPIRKQNDETNTRVNRDADALSLSGPGKARVSCPAPAPAGQPSSSDNRPPDVVGGQLLTADGQPDVAAVPWQWLVGRARQADLDRAEALAWRDWYTKNTAAEQAAKHQP